MTKYVDCTDTLKFFIEEMTNTEMDYYSLISLSLGEIVLKIKSNCAISYATV